MESPEEGSLKIDSGFPTCEVDPGCPIANAYAHGNATGTTCSEVANGGDVIYQAQTCDAVCMEGNEQIGFFRCSYGHLWGGSYCIWPGSGYTVRIVDVVGVIFQIELSAASTVWVLREALAIMIQLDQVYNMWKVQSDLIEDSRRLGELVDQANDRDAFDLIAQLTGHLRSGHVLQGRRLPPGGASGSLSFVVEMGAIIPSPDDENAMLTQAGNLGKASTGADTRFRDSMTVQGSTVGSINTLVQEHVYQAYVLYGPDGLPVFYRDYVYDALQTCDGLQLSPMISNGWWNCSEPHNGTRMPVGTVCTLSCTGSSPLRSHDANDPNVVPPIAAKWVSATCMANLSFSYPPSTNFGQLYCAEADADGTTNTIIVLLLLIGVMAILVITVVACYAGRRQPSPGQEEQVAAPEVVETPVMPPVSPPQAAAPEVVAPVEPEITYTSI